MYTQEQTTQMLNEHTRLIAAVSESVKSAHHRIGEMKELTKSVHELAQSNTAIATEVKLLAQKFDKSIERIESGQKSQGERIGNIERSLQQIERNEKDIAKNAEDIEGIKQIPAQRWKMVVEKVITLIVAAAMGGLLAQFLGG